MPIKLGVFWKNFGQSFILSKFWKFFRNFRQNFQIFGLPKIIGKLASLLNRLPWPSNRLLRAGGPLCRQTLVQIQLDSQICTKHPISQLINCFKAPPLMLLWKVVGHDRLEGIGKRCHFPWDAAGQQLILLKANNEPINNWLNRIIIRKNHTRI